MYIKKIVLDGFKSYGKRIEVNDFDVQFNAITGLNGTGKSNILDSICFVLGITNLGHVRAGSLQDLIYKSGQAGVTKATVSITFDNSKFSQSPPGYENFKEIVVSRQIVMGGKNKYWINGILVQNKKVHDLFCSIQLNVNNPHFLIMQGKVTKVLNMKAHEILAMIEEAAGTRMYETKRQAAQKTIEKKDQKMVELKTIMKEEVYPKLEKLRGEREIYLEFMRVERELEHLMALYIAWEFYASQRNTKRAQEKLSNAEEKVKNIENSIAENKTTIQELSVEIEEISKEANEQTGGHMKELETEIKSAEGREAKLKAQVKSAKESLKSEEKKILQLEKNCKDDGATLTIKEQELSTAQDVFETLKKNDADDAAAFAQSQKKYEAVCAGMEVDEEGQAATLEEQLMKAKQEAANASTEMETASRELKQDQLQLEEKEQELGSNNSELKKDQANLQNAEKELQKVEQSLSKLNYSEEKMNELQTNCIQLRNDIKNYRDKIENFEARRPYTGFRYRDPDPNFNRKDVHGVVCKLIKVKDPKYSLALETAAGGRLYNVIVENDTTSKILLQRGQLQRRTTFIPLNKIQGNKIDNRTTKLAQDLVGKENVQPALSLIEYDPKLRLAMEFIFGSVFICSNMQSARQVTFDKRIHKKCVTLDGDVADPGGTLSGGAVQKGTPVLMELESILEAEECMKLKEQELAHIEAEIQRMQHSQQQYENLKQRYELKKHELDILRTRLEQTSHHQHQKEVDALKENIVHLKERLVQCKEMKQKCVSRAKELELTMKDAKGHKERLLKAAESEMKACKAKADKSKNEWQKREQEYNTIHIEIQELKKSIVETKKQIEIAKENLIKLEEEVEEVSVSFEEIKSQVKELQAEFAKEKAAVSAKNKVIQTKNKKKEQLAAQNSELQLEIQKMDHEIKILRDEYDSAFKTETEIAKKTKNDENNLEKAASLSEKEAHELKSNISKRQQHRDKLGRTVNTKAQSMYDQEEKQYAGLHKKMKIVLNDKLNLLAVIADLDKQKREALRLAYEQVKKDFGSIFSTLLPGANATLQPPPSKSILEGLEVKVSLGGVWKESLTELSGGQRSLAALSLILAMLLFKPAPLYILDEVDAALDLSHTQNIGNMLKTHFQQSQFIIVSLKDGMFNNANVLFRTNFIDGMSSVSCSINKSSN